MLQNKMLPVEKGTREISPVPGTTLSCPPVAAMSNENVRTMHGRSWCSLTPVPGPEMNVRHNGPLSFCLSEACVFGIKLYNGCVGHGGVDMVYIFCIYSVSFETKELEGLSSQSTVMLSGGRRHITPHPPSISADALDCLNAIEQETHVIVLRRDT